MRLHFLDSGRALASFLGLVYHSALMFVNVDWLVNAPDTHTLPALGVYTEYINLFRMPLFMFISGYFAAYAVRKYNLKNFAVRRMTRLGIPFVTTLLTFSFIEKIYAYKYWGGDISFLPKTVIPWSRYFQMSHLWFLHYALVFSFILYFALMLKRRFPLKLFDRLKLGGKYTDVLFLAGIFGIFGICGMLFLVTRFDHQLVSFLTFGSYFPYFMLGALAFLRRDELHGKFFELSRKRFVVLFILLIVSYIPATLFRGIVPYTNTLLDTLPRYFSLILVLGLLYRFLNKPNRVLTYMSESSYTVYLLHQPLIVMVGYYYVKHFLLPSPWLGYLLVLTVSTILTYSLDYLLVRSNRWGKFLYTGVLPFKRRAGVAVQQSAVSN
jgi:peptidoglycan/LPS O-acetylase OafA/YrhL